MGIGTLSKRLEIGDFLIDKKMKEKDKLEALRRHIDRILPDGVKVTKEEIQELKSQLDQINIPKKSEMKKVKLGKDYLMYAYQDLESYKVLFKGKIYANSIFHLQQAVEKTIKAYCLILLPLNTYDLKILSHKTPLFIIRLFQKRGMDYWSKLVKKYNPELKKSIQDLEALFINKPKRDEYELIAIFSENQIMNLLKSQEHQKDKSIASGEEYIRIMTRKKETKEEELFNYILKKTYDNQLSTDLIVSLINLFILSMVTYPHYIYSRYPHKNFKIPYHEKLGIVKVSPKACEMIGTAISKVDEYAYINYDPDYRKKMRKELEKEYDKILGK